MLLTLDFQTPCIGDLCAQNAALGESDDACHQDRQPTASSVSQSLSFLPFALTKISHEYTYLAEHDSHGLIVPDDFDSNKTLLGSV